VDSTILSCTSRPGPCRILVTGYELPYIGIAHYDSDEDYDDEGGGRVAAAIVDMVAAWSVDRLGRSLINRRDFLRELPAKGVDLFLHQQGLDTSTPSGRPMFQMLGAFAEFELSMIWGLDPPHCSGSWGWAWERCCG
jgi:hypothetical protein